MHSENLTPEETAEFLERLIRGEVVMVDESGFHCITQKGRELLRRWDVIDSSIIDDWSKRDQPRAKPGLPRPGYEFHRE